MVLIRGRVQIFAFSFICHYTLLALCRKLHPKSHKSVLKPHVFITVFFPFIAPLPINPLPLFASKINDLLEDEKGNLVFFFLLQCPDSSKQTRNSSVV